MRNDVLRGLMALVIWIGMTVALVGCQDDATTEQIDTKCKIEGRCECLSNIDCRFGDVCVDGICRPVSTIDTSTDTGVIDSTVTDTGPDSTDTTLVEGGFLWPCVDNTDCDSNKCISLSASEKVCTRTCSDICPDGFACRGVSTGASLGFFCLPVLDRLCEPCTVDAACPGEDSLCVSVGTGTHCSQACGDGCPSGYICQTSTSVDGVTADQCVPESGFCTCTADSVGAVIPCSEENAFGVCFGSQQCQEGSVLTACSAALPAVEVCDGQDNDCNGFADDNVPASTCENTNTFGTCEGQVVCLAAVGEVCTAGVPEAEVCDNLDNNCDGAVDESFRDAAGRYNEVANCGACGNSCEGRFANATAVACDVDGDAPACVITTCASGFVLSEGTRCVRPADLLCDPCTTDAVCGGPNDRCVQVDPTDTRNFCTRDCAADNIYGGGCPTGYTCDTLTLDGETVEQCVPENASCDCTAANAGQTRPCTMQNAAGTCFGVATCDATMGWSGCTAKTPATEACNDLDDNCNGLTDEGFGGAACDRTNTFGTCVGQLICDGQAQALTCAGPDAEVEACDGVDNNCDGDIDDPFALSIRGNDGALLALKYSLSEEHCGGCGIACVARSPVAEVRCNGDGQDVFCGVEACDPGFYVFNDRACLPIPTGNLCLPCGDDSECQGPDDTCLPYDGGRCGRDCSEGSIYSVGDPGDAGYCDGAEGEQGCCPSGYLCGGGQCQRESLACDCNVEGKERPCSASSGFGVCAGVETCVVSGPGAGWQPCDAPIPSAEICDGIDNDCDGLIDKADSSVDTTGLAGYPTCENVSSACTGQWTCSAATGAYAWSCTAAQPKTEVCNGRDDNCDSVIDDGFVNAEGRYASVENCGQCGLDCRAALANLQMSGGAVAAGAVACQVIGGQPTCVPQDCAPDFQLFPTTGTPELCLPLVAPNCQPCSDASECGLGGTNSCVSVGSDNGQYCAQPCDAAAPFEGCTGVVGQQGCCPDSFSCQTVGSDKLCQPDSGSCQCTASNDGLTRLCSATGNGGASTCFGVETCADGAQGYDWGSCDLSANVEVCDGLDNNCDGVTDEGFLIAGAYSTNENCGECGQNCGLAFSADTQHVFGICSTAGGAPACVSGGCLGGAVGGGGRCRATADCGGGEVCDDVLGLCIDSCDGDGDCSGGEVCRDGSCAAGCTGDASCQATYGAEAVCDAGRCVTLIDWVDLDGEPGNGCECPAIEDLALDTPDLFDTEPTAGDRYRDSNCDGIDGDLATAVFVASDAVGGDGSLGAPFGSIQQAINAFSGADTHILVASGVYPERIALKNGVQIFGGYSADFSERDIVLFPTVIEGPAPSGSATPGTVRAEVITQPTTLAGFTIVGYDATEPGVASYAVYIRASSNALVLVGNTIIAGKGAAGARGANGATGVAGGAGANGLKTKECANNTCTGGVETQPGGAGGTNPSCAASPGCRGMEADTDEDPQTIDNAAAGCTYVNGGDQGRYSGSDASYCKYDFNPQGNQTGPNGGDGGLGSAGNGGGGCNDVDGVISSNRWSAGSGGSGGTVGTPGTGGQGGSAGGWVNNIKTTACTVPVAGGNFGDIGGSGAGGGAGGCGGTGGSPGGGGGASFAVFISGGASGSFATLTANAIVRGVGGQGGRGGNGGTGGKGGIGGTGGLAIWPAWGGGIGGNGGRGGDGGGGGGGGGGCGGPSFGIAGVGIPAALYTSGNVFQTDNSVATGGLGGGPGTGPGLAGDGTAGVMGQSSNVKVY